MRVSDLIARLEQLQSGEDLPIYIYATDGTKFPLTDVSRDYIDDEPVIILSPSPSGSTTSNTRHSTHDPIT